MGVTGIGGLFFRSRDPKALAVWYQDRLGITKGAWEQQAGTTAFSPFANDTDYFPPDRQWMLNLRVEGLDALIVTLEAAGIAVERRDEWNSTDYGCFARLHDPEGNPIELWEPAG